MAITILQEPLIPDMSNKDLIYLVSSNQTSQPQFQYVCDIKEADGTLIQRIKQQANPAGKAVFNIGQIITNNLAFDPTLIKTEPSDNTGNNNNIFSANTLERWADDFIIAFGEEYGTSVSSSVTLYGPSTVSSTHPTSSFFAGTKDFNELPNSYSWISGSLPRQDQADYENNLTLGFADARKFYNAVEVESGSGAGTFELDGLWLTNYPNEEGVDKYGFGSDFTATNPTRKVYKIRKKDFLT